MMNRMLLACVGVGLMASIAVAQASPADSLLLTNEFTFNNGIYRTLDEWQRNAPSIAWSSVAYDAYANEEKRTIQLRDLRTKDGDVLLPLDSLWGICVDGVPYVRVAIPSRKVQEFVALRTRGRICYFNYEGYVMRDVPMTIYNPRTGEPVMRRIVQNKELHTFEKMLRFEDGAITDFDLQAFKAWIQDRDPVLYDTLADYTESEAGERLYKSLKIFNDRNPVYVR